LPKRSSEVRRYFIGRQWNDSRHGEFIAFPKKFARLLARRPVVNRIESGKIRKS